MYKDTEEKDYYTREKKTWDTYAGLYNFTMAPMSRVRRTVVEIVAAPAGSRILDVATGTGKQAFAFARCGYDVTGIDLSESMLTIARRTNKYTNLNLQAADAAALPFENKSFDYSTVSLALHEMPLTIREKVLKEMVRVTKTGITIIEFGLPNNRIGRFFIYALAKSVEGDHYVKFMKTDFRATILQAGIAIDREIRILFGGARIFKGSIKA